MNHEITHTPETVRHFSVQLSSTLRGARLARLLAVEQLRSWEIPLEAPAQIVAELAANAVTHGNVRGRDFLLSMRATTDTLRIEATDTRRDREPVVSVPGAEDEGGRGLLLVSALSDDWGVERGPVPRKTVWAELALR
ncbi:ATP-binding protein [Streptomyces sp. NPDC007088]|uniref:ATP-binding protein n=1 Tax=Streptomyces sp. NPDC007088 TaxID=3364773 RepID=UPI0036C66A88